MLASLCIIVFSVKDFGRVDGNNNSGSVRSKYQFWFADKCVNGYPACLTSAEHREDTSGNLEETSVTLLCVSRV